MSTATENIQLPFTDDGFQTFLGSRLEPDWLTHIRADAWKRYSELAWPSVREEEWMRTDIRLFKLDKFSIPGTPPLTVPNIQPTLSSGVELAGSLTSCNGVGTLVTPLDPELAERGVIFGKLSDLVSEHGELIQKYLFQTVDGAADRFAALHQATWSNGLFLYVPRNVCIEKPFHTLATLSAGGSDFSHTLIVLEEGAEATVCWPNRRTWQEKLVCIAVRSRFLSVTEPIYAMSICKTGANRSGTLPIKRRT